MTLILAGSLMSAGAENALTGTKFTDNWSVGVNAGVTQPLAHPYSIGENIRPQVGVELYKQFTPVLKTGVEFNVGINTTGIYGNRGVRTAFDHANLNLLGGLNLMNLFGGYKGSPRVFEIEALGGIGVGHVFGCKDADGSMAHKNYMTSKFGLNLGFNIGKAKQFTLAVKPAIVYNIEGRSQSNNAVAFNSNKANFELMAGLAYHSRQATERIISLTRVFTTRTKSMVLTTKSTISVVSSMAKTTISRLQTTESTISTMKLNA